ncbi:hypothetical protein AB0I61_13060 [Polymorphospora rubra]|uniref:hypothetical protein n=1 Tax=Polymorphospora rubra TaxID=338584 RepID=UPI003401DCA5
MNVLRGPEPMPEPAPPPPPPAPPPGRLTERRDLTAPLVVPASGYIFTFNVYAAFVWVSNGLPREVLNGSAQHFMPYAVRELKAIAASRARHHPAHHARELEVELQRILTDRGNWRYRRGDVEVTCRPYVWVELEDRVKRAVQPYWEQLIKLDCEHDVQMKRAEYAEQMSKQWLAILADLVGSPLADGAAQMTEKEFAAVVEKIVAERKAAAAKLDSLLEEKVRDGDAFDRAEHFELLKERLERFATSAFAGSGARSPNGAASSTT